MAAGRWRRHARCSRRVDLTTIQTVAETGSTNADMIALAQAGSPEGWWLRAERQVAGKGRQGRDWVSPIGNFHGSTLVRLRAGDPPPATLALMAAVAVEEAAAIFVPSPPVRTSSFSRKTGKAATASPASSGEGRLSIKWPNDLLLGGAKVAGVLLERAGDAVVAGVGVNLAHHPDLPERSTTSLAEHGAAVGPEAFADALVDTFARWLGRWRGEGLGPVRRRWLDRAHPLGTALVARLPDGSAIDGLFDGLDADGALLLRLAGGERRVIHAGDVFLL